MRNYNPMAKVLFAIGGIFLSLIFNSVYIDISIIVVMTLLIIAVAKIPIKSYFKLLLVPLGFLLISIITIIITFSKDSIYIYSFTLFNKTFGITSSSLKQGLKLTTRVVSSISSTYFLILTTPLNDLIRVFNKLKMPDLLIELIILTYRAIFIFLEEWRNIYVAQDMKFGYDGLKNSYNSIGLLVRNLFIRIFIRYKDMITTLDCKLYEGKFKLGD
ncbi:cobalt ECF transporter T component CbiQ [Tissierella simiarum]|uniref:cobalt ECF transporter T component CbiQ n=1 Tax=Tissierella simiarum TaxID=2841534 RepID=UPI002484CC75|nr:cobalt ECF transporter T component CbiQ [Tissierella simiarum]